MKWKSLANNFYKQIKVIHQRFPFHSEIVIHQRFPFHCEISFFYLFLFLFLFVGYFFRPKLMESVYLSDVHVSGADPGFCVREDESRRGVSSGSRF
jgi:hypothetical protein